MSLDFHSLVASYALLRVLEAAALAYVWLVHTRYGPLRELALGSVMVALGSVSVWTTTGIPTAGPIVSQTVLIALGVGLFNVGLVRLSDRPAPWSLAVTWTALAVVIKLALSLVWPSNAASVVVTSVFVGGCGAYAVVCLVRVRPGPLRLTQWIIAGLVVVQFAGIVGRAIAVVAMGDGAGVADTGRFVASTPGQSGFLLAAMAASFLLTVAIAVLANQRLQRALDIAASVDPLTGLMNRRAFSELADRGWAQARRRDQVVSVLLLDLDHFKSFNDLHGHKAGDAVLRLVGETLAREVRGRDVVCRFGGEEFVVLMPDATGKDAERLAERLRAVIRTPRCA